MTSLFYQYFTPEEQAQGYIHIAHESIHTTAVPRSIRPIYSLSRPYETLYLSEKLNRFPWCSARVQVPEKVVQWLYTSLGWSPPSVLTLTGVSSSTSYSYFPHVLPILTHPLPARVSREIPTMLSREEELVHSLNLVKVMGCVITLTRSYLHGENEESGEDGEVSLQNLTHLVHDRENDVYILAFHHVILLYIPRLYLAVLWTLDDENNSPFYLAMGKDVRVGKMGSTDYRVEYVPSKSSETLEGVEDKCDDDEYSVESLVSLEDFEGFEGFDALITTADKRLEMAQRQVAPNLLTLRNRFTSAYSSYEEVVCTDILSQTSLELFRKNGVDVWSIASAGSGGIRRSISRAMLFDGSVDAREYQTEAEADINTGLRRRLTIRRDAEVLFDQDENGVKVDKLAEIGRAADGTRIGWKVAKSTVGGREIETIVQLAIPDTAQVVVPVHPNFSSDHVKMRCDGAVVVSITPAVWSGYDESGCDEKIDTALSCVYVNTTVEYRIGCMVHPDRFDTDPGKTCTGGIHYFPDYRSLFLTYCKQKVF